MTVNHHPWYPTAWVDYLFDQGDIEDMYTPSEQQAKALANNFTYHQPLNNQPERYVRIRAHAKALAELITECCPPSRELSLAMTKLEECVFWANASIARNE